jgi:hypothetical protein
MVSGQSGCHGQMREGRAGMGDLQVNDFALFVLHDYVIFAASTGGDYGESKRRMRGYEGCDIFLLLVRGCLR